MFALYLHFLYSRARIPVASQVTALEIWLLACILLVFGALAEYAFILRQVINLTRQQRRLRQKMANEGLSSFSSPPAVFAPGASLTSNSVGGRNGGPREEWPMRGFGGMAGTPEERRDRHLHQHHSHVQQQPQVSLETHQTDRGANTTIAATTHHLHEMEVSLRLKSFPQPSRETFQAFTMYYYEKSEETIQYQKSFTYTDFGAMID